MCMSTIQRMLFSLGHFLRHFNIIIVKHHGISRGCGSTTNDMDTGETVSFTCHPQAEGSSLKITIVDRVRQLILCEVSVFGKGMNCLYI